MRPITLALLIAAGLIATIVASYAQPTRPVVLSSEVGPWEMLATGTGPSGFPGVFLLNSRTGMLLICVLTPSQNGPPGGCVPMPNSP